MTSTAAAASDGAVGVGLSILPAPDTLVELDFLDPPGEKAGSVEEEERVTGEDAEVCFVRIRNGETNVPTGFGWSIAPLGPGRTFQEDSVFKDCV